MNIKANDSLIRNPEKSLDKLLEGYVKENTKKKAAEMSDSYTSLKFIFHILITVLIESFYELLTCSAVSMRMFDYRKYWELPDKISVALSFIALAALIAFIFFNLYFTFYRARQLSILHLYLNRLVN